MAKLTAQDALGATPASGDLFHVVDVSDTTDDADGSSKKVTYTELLPASSATVAGKVELATTAETTTGTDATRAVTPDGLHDMTSLAGATWFLDEDTMSSDSETKVPSQQSVKAYVDTEVAAIDTFPVDGWNEATGTWTYASANTITVPSGAASLYQKGDRIKWTQTTARYGVITTVADTLLTIAVNTDYVVDNAAITAPYYSHQVNPVGYPNWFAFTPTGPTNTTLTGRFSVVGRSCTAVIRGACTGAVDWTNKPTLPITSGASIMGVGTYFPYMRGGYLDTGTSNNPNAAFGIFADSSAVVTIYTSAAAGWSATVPITWASGDAWEIIGTYEI